MAKSWSIKNLYFYLVCLVTLFLFVGGAISAINNAMQLTLPDKPNVPLIYVYYPEYKGDPAQPVFEPPPLEELEKRRAEQEKADIYYQGYTKRSLLNSIALMIIALPFYCYHWKQVKPVSRKRGVSDEN
jgi:hypothetical protein